MDDFYEYLIKTNCRCVKNVGFKNIKMMDHIVIFGTRAYKLIERVIEEIKKINSNIKIVFILREYMYENMKKLISKNDDVIFIQGDYSENIVEILKEKNYYDDIDGIIFYTLQKFDMGNFNILNIANNIKKNIIVYGITKDYELYEYNNLNYYLIGMQLYLDIDNYIDKSLQIYGEIE